MEKHEHMVYQNKIKNQAKVEKAIKAIHKLLREEQQVVVCTLVKCTGLSRAFFTIMKSYTTNLLRRKACKKVRRL